MARPSARSAVSSWCCADVLNCLALGPRKRHAELLARLSEYRPLDFNTGARNLFAPAGLDIGSEAPEEIALSMTSEIAAVLSDRRGGLLRERKSDIQRTTAAGS